MIYIRVRFEFHKYTKVRDKMALLSVGAEMAYCVDNYSNREMAIIYTDQFTSRPVPFFVTGSAPPT